MFVVGEAFWFPIALYVPALTFNQVTGVDVHIITPIVCGIVTFYTCVGGLKAVVWTDVLQSGVMYGSIILVMIKGTIDVGGLQTVWDRNMESGRLEFPTMTLDPTVRTSIFAVLVGATFIRLQGSSIHQVGVQRFLSLPSTKHVKHTLILSSVGLTLLLASCVYTGLLAYATYYDCDPMTTGLSKEKDQIVPLFIMRVLGVYPGLPGIFVSGVFSAALSSLSSSMNSISAVIYEDFVKKYKKDVSASTAALVMRLTVLIFGLMSFFMVFVVEKLGTVMQLSATLTSITQGPLLAIFTIGMCLPWINSKATITGAVTAFIIMMWTCFKAQLAIASGEMVFRPKPVSVDGCTYEFLNTVMSNTTTYVEDVQEKTIYHMSFLLYCPLGFTITIVIALLSSLYFGWNDTSEVDRSLIAEPFHRFLRQKTYETVTQEDVYKQSCKVMES